MIFFVPNNLAIIDFDSKRGMAAARRYKAIMLGMPNFVMKNHNCH